MTDVLDQAGIDFLPFLTARNPQTLAEVAFVYNGDDLIVVSRAQLERLVEVAGTLNAQLSNELRNLKGES